ncbi:MULTISPECIES: molybdopterin-dependent oxidoreductase [unclassified Corallococcus]|uniref:molybdopterin-dependent oxidoreductase n=1 Tax=unclassified Corallococcus TaxID=2685029 RepID=UPI001A8D8866|nr:MULTISPECIES: molybdopterin-dependent oxidoreductase [unclassified Corallococcus]MBN9681623.1 molybdopterin-dependent oxidoreductase [Corallococcus sp. NCSPR001]WAS86803.1 molybdopterin-dependent oxidoreductase [Corallococcus sp. NCRR]
MPAERVLTRRRVLLGAAALATSACDSQRPRAGFLGVMDRFNERAQAALFHPHRLAPEEPVEQLTPPGDFPHYFISDTVPLAPAGWRLEVGGLVARPRAFTLEELRRLPRTDYRIRHHCVEGWSAVASWHGVALRDLAQAVGADPRAGFVEFRSFDQGYYSSWDAPSALHPQTVLAYGMNGAPLIPGHGAPLRLYSGVKLGYKMVKYLTTVRFLPEPTGGTWEDRGYEWFAGV